MTQEKAKLLAELLGGEAQQVGESWVVLRTCDHGMLLVVSDESIREFSDRGAFLHGYEPNYTIWL